ncbi:helix-turn-helix transcriptional regulator [Paraglaciecola chathamensis]|jgi:transcriptional regulator with XRE-family HTH domain|uniref:helix-turn-helix domain-containing protein n=1 Tax=Paraglaciecola chathamensis TaxID=368405 RepID=UPI00270A5DAF|nr:helix-turn-helix transcriptional regulator [Paraglaciecola chathamensis]MDO6839500.1 helix-turn-helix transcriptional regulator [Paraglaciecola chathamensis]
MKKSTNDKHYTQLLSWLKNERIKKGITARELGLLLDEPFQIVSKIEKGQRKLFVYEYIQYCEALEVDPDEGLKKLKSGSQSSW